MLEAIILSLCVNYTCQIVDYGYKDEVRQMTVHTTKVKRQHLLETLTPSAEFTGMDTQILVLPLKTL